MWQALLFAYPIAINPFCIADRTLSCSSMKDVPHSELHYWFKQIRVFHCPLPETRLEGGHVNPILAQRKTERGF